MIAVQLGFQPDTVIERQGSGVMRFDLQARAFCAWSLAQAARPATTRRA